MEQVRTLECLVQVSAAWPLLFLLPVRRELYSQMLMMFPSSLSPRLPPAAEAPQAPTSYSTVCDELLYQMSAQREGVSAGESPIFPAHARLSDCSLLLLCHCYFLWERSGWVLSRALNDTWVSFLLLLTVFSIRGQRPMVEPFPP